MFIYETEEMRKERIKKQILKSQVKKWADWEKDLKKYNQSKKNYVKRRTCLEEHFAEEQKEKARNRKKPFINALFNLVITKEKYTNYDTENLIEVFFDYPVTEWKNFKQDVYLNQFFIYFKDDKKSFSKRAYIQGCKPAPSLKSFVLVFAPVPKKQEQ